MPPLLTTAATILCAHGGRVAIIPRQTKVLAGGSPVVCVPDLMGAPIAGCALPPTPATKPCTTVAAIFPGSWSMRVLAGGKPVYLQTLMGLTDGVPPSPLMVVFPGQLTVQGSP
ncbi:MAG TPA: hypothetical protein VGW10_16715 [Solirubrobacteraceae bacterium]|nr:hypothetical protein [Solirubrobacteraceae bacterium]